MTAWSWGYEVEPGPGHWTWTEYGYWPNVATGPGVAAWPYADATAPPCGHTQTPPRSWRPYADVAAWPPSKRPVTEFATVLAAIDANVPGEFVHVTQTQHSRNCFPAGFEQVMSGSFGIQCSIRKRPRDGKGRVKIAGAEIIVKHAGHYVEKICESLALPRAWYPKHWGPFEVISFGARWLTKELKDEFEARGGLSTDKMRAALKKQGYRPDLILDGMRKFDDPETRDPELRNHTGYHPQILKGIALSHEFVDFVTENKQRILEPIGASASYAATRYQTTRRIFIWCRSGRHRSVALTVLMKACLEHDGFAVEANHLKKSWKHLCGGPGNCEACNAAPWVSDGVKMAKVVWASVP